MTPSLPHSLSQDLAENLKTQFHPAPEVKTFQLERGKATKIKVAGEEIEITWSDVNLEEADGGPSFNVTLKESSGADAFYINVPPQDSSRAGIIGNVIFFTSMKNGSSFHGDPSQMQLELITTSKFPVLFTIEHLKTRFAKILHDEVITKKGMEKTTDLLSGWKKDQKLTILRQLKVLPGFNLEYKTITDMGAFTRFFSWARNEFSRDEVKIWLSKQKISHPIYRYWIEGKKASKAIKQEVATANYPEDEKGLSLIVDLTVDAKDVEMLSLLEAKISQKMSLSGIETPHPKAMEAHMASHKRWQSLQKKFEEAKAKLN